MDELSQSGGSEGYGACGDEAQAGASGVKAARVVAQRLNKG